jgi:hypothetical protein
MRKITRGMRVTSWIEHYCVYPGGAQRGLHVKLTMEQKATLCALYDQREQQEPLRGPLAAYVALLHTCGIEARQNELVPLVDVDLFTVWAAAGPDLRAVLRQQGEHITCPELGTTYPRHPTVAARCSP